jgi:hypothetical protein
MKWSTNWTMAACLGCAICALAATAPAQEPDLDLELTNVEVVVFGKSTDFQLRPTVTQYNFGNLASHALEIAMIYGPIGVRLIQDEVTFLQEENDCWQQSILNCGAGTCLDIYTGLGWLEGFCTSGGARFLRCACAHIIHKEFEWIPYTFGYNTVIVRVDPNNLVEETDETNNEVIIDIGAVVNESETWGAIKSMYR